MTPYQKAIDLFCSKESGFVKCLKARFWFRVKANWIESIMTSFHRRGMDRILEAHPFILYMSRMHAFMAVGEPEEKRLERVVDHYASVWSILGEKGALDLFDKGLPLLSFDLDGKNIALLVKYDHRMRFEGQLSLIMLVDGEEAYYIHFLLSENAMWIGGIQGMKGFIDFNKWFTKKTFGLRPQNFLYFVLTLLAERFGMHSVYGIRSQSHVYQNEKKSQDKIRFSYDAFWEELGAVEKDAQWVSLPLVYPRKNEDSIKPKKRGQYRKRYHWMDEISLGEFGE